MQSMSDTVNSERQTLAPRHLPMAAEHKRLAIAGNSVSEFAYYYHIEMRTKTSRYRKYYADCLGTLVSHREKSADHILPYHRILPHRIVASGSAGALTLIRGTSPETVSGARTICVDLLDGNQMMEANSSFDARAAASATDGAARGSEPLDGKKASAAADVPGGQAGREHTQQETYWDSLFSGNVCCKLWFTVPRASTKKLLSRLTDLLRAAIVDQREEINSHIPIDVIRTLAGHTRGKVCIVNHKSFWPHPPTLLHLFGDLKLYWAEKRVRNWRKRSLCWGYHGLGCIRPRALGLEENNVAESARATAMNNSKDESMLAICSGLPAEEARRTGAPEKHKAAKRSKQEKEAASHTVKQGGGGLSWGRAFNWKAVFAKHNVNLCFDKWVDLEWLPNNADSNVRPSSLLSLLEDETFAAVDLQGRILVKEGKGEGGRDSDSSRKGEIHGTVAEICSKGTAGHDTTRKKPWETDPNASCIRIVRSVSPQRLGKSSTCTQIDISLRVQESKPDQSRATVEEMTATEATAGGKEDTVVLPACLFSRVDTPLKCTVCGSIYPSASGSSPPPLTLTEDETMETSRDHLATVEFQRMWPVFIRIDRQTRTPVSFSPSGCTAASTPEVEVLFLGCILEAFHMRLKTQQDISGCLSAIADVTKAKGKQAPEKDVEEATLAASSQVYVKYLPRTLFEPAPSFGSSQYSEEHTRRRESPSGACESTGRKAAGQFLSNASANSGVSPFDCTSASRNSFGTHDDSVVDVAVCRFQVTLIRLR
ncbi:uncharacterized protein LOC34617843 [Cyclospora cayetanensis]|uniref:Uncharacterized protein LOC34617843 n=1 Tax=Cyclospora cayetanensis TaxID=88456 RepID=A0A6P6RRG2_9EIME|nr:uncharacterized protein LOC34617843 [Cyclospora cayetanensis]